MGPVEANPEYKLIVQANNLSVEIENEISECKLMSNAEINFFFCTSIARRGYTIALYHFLAKTLGEMGLSWHMGFVRTLSFPLTANYDFTK